MMKAFAATVLASLAVYVGGFALVGCDSTTESTFDPPPQPDAAIEQGPPIVPPVSTEKDGGGAETGPISCAPSIPTTFAPTWKAPTKSEACSSADVKGYYDACLADPAKTEGDGTCTKWKTDHADCAACAEPSDGTGPIQWHVDRMFYTLNVAGCLDVQQDDEDLETCGEKYNAAVQCTRKSCETCFASGGTFPEFRECQKSVQGQGTCKDYEAQIAPACPGYKTSGAPTALCFAGTGETQEAHFTRVVGLICSAP